MVIEKLNLEERGKYGLLLPLFLLEIINLICKQYISSKRSWYSLKTSESSFVLTFYTIQIHK